MISEMIKSLRENAGYSQSELAKKLDVTRSSVNAWEMDLSIPTTPYIVEMAKLFHVSTDYILGIENAQTISLDGYSDKEIELVYKLIQYFDDNK
jgi:transcriptional regulator with XRE-family HTH domain